MNVICSKTGEALFMTKIIKYWTEILNKYKTGQVNRLDSTELPDM